MVFALGGFAGLMNIQSVKVVWDEIPQRACDLHRRINRWLAEGYDPLDLRPQNWLKDTGGVPREERIGLRCRALLPHQYRPYNSPYEA